MEAAVAEYPPAVATDVRAACESAHAADEAQYAAEREAERAARHAEWMATHTAPGWDKVTPGTELTPAQWVEVGAHVKAGDTEWLIEHWLWIVPEEGAKCRLLLTPFQRRLLREEHSRNVVVKARKAFVTTIEQAIMMVSCIIYPNHACGLAFHTKDSGTKKVIVEVRQMYADMPKQVRDLRKLTKDDKTMLMWDNGSSLIVGDCTGYTLHRLHVSEYGKMCAEFPDEADKIVSGTFQAVASKSVITVESTSYGDDGRFKHWCVGAQELELRGQKPNRLQWKLFFQAWHEQPKYRMRDAAVVIPDWADAYFTRLLKDHAIELHRDQKVWWFTKYRNEFDKTGEAGSGLTAMKQQYPSYMQEAFESIAEGAIYQTQFNFLYKNDRIGDFPFDPMRRVGVAWDLGMSKTDSMAMWFYQVRGHRVYLIDYHEERTPGETWAYYKNVLNARAEKEGYVYEDLFLAPHDILRNEYGDGRRIESAAAMGINFAPPQKVTRSVQADIDRVKTFLLICWFNESKCQAGLAALKAYKRRYHISTRTWSDNPAKDWTNHGSDAFRTLAMGLRFADDAIEVPEARYEGYATRFF